MCKLETPLTPWDEGGRVIVSRGYVVCDQDTYLDSFYAELWSTHVLEDAVAKGTVYRFTAKAGVKYYAEVKYDLGTRPGGCIWNKTTVNYKKGGDPVKHTNTSPMKRFGGDC